MFFTLLAKDFALKSNSKNFPGVLKSSDWKIFVGGFPKPKAVPSDVTVHERGTPFASLTPANTMQRVVSVFEKFPKIRKVLVMDLDVHKEIMNEIRKEYKERHDKACSKIKAR